MLNQLTNSYTHTTHVCYLLEWALLSEVSARSSIHMTKARKSNKTFYVDDHNIKLHERMMDENFYYNGLDLSFLPLTFNRLTTISMTNTRKAVVYPIRRILKGPANS